MLSSEDEEDIISSDEEDEHNAWNFFRDVVGQGRSGMRVEGFFEDEELARTALGCHLSMDLLCCEDVRRVTTELFFSWWSTAFWAVTPDLGTVD